jgi:hypothetical protein
VLLRPCNFSYTFSGERRSEKASLGTVWSTAYRRFWIAYCEAWAPPWPKPSKPTCPWRLLRDFSQRLSRDSQNQRVKRLSSFCARNICGRHCVTNFFQRFSPGQTNYTRDDTKVREEGGVLRVGGWLGRCCARGNSDAGTGVTAAIALHRCTVCVDILRAVRSEIPRHPSVRSTVSSHTARAHPSVDCSSSSSSPQARHGDLTPRLGWRNTVGSRGSMRTVFKAYGSPPSLPSTPDLEKPHARFDTAKEKKSIWAHRQPAHTGRPGQAGLQTIPHLCTAHRIASHRPILPTHSACPPPHQPPSEPHRHVSTDCIVSCL